MAVTMVVTMTSRHGEDAGHEVDRRLQARVVEDARRHPHLGRGGAACGGEPLVHEHPGARAEEAGRGARHRGGLHRVGPIRRAPARGRSSRRRGPAPKPGVMITAAEARSSSSRRSAAAPLRDALGTAGVPVGEEPAQLLAAATAPVEVGHRRRHPVPVEVDRKPKSTVWMSGAATSMNRMRRSRSAGASPCAPPPGTASGRGRGRARARERHATLR